MVMETCIFNPSYSVRFIHRILYLTCRVLYVYLQPYCKKTSQRLYWLLGRYRAGERGWVTEYFHTGDNPFSFVFDGWMVSSVLTVVFTCLAVGAVSLLFEGIRVLRLWMRKHLQVAPLYSIVSEDLGDTNDPAATAPVNASYIVNNRIKNHVGQTFLHLVRVISGYFLMLAFMTYNVYICLSILLGATLGYFLFCHELSRWRESPPCSVNITPATSLSSAASTEEAHPMRPTTSSKIRDAECTG